jgi:glucose-6-phosphate dehydrogenase assembly protein OpcA
MSNLVVFCRSAADAEVDLAAEPEDIPIDDVVRNHPARVLVLHHDPDASQDGTGPEPPLSAHVGVLTFGARDARYGVEQIVIKSACSEAALPSIVRALIPGDVPTSIWWTEDLAGTRPVTPLVSMGRQLLYDSRSWRDVGRAVLALAPVIADPFGPDLADVNWRRLQPVRQALLHALESSDGPHGPRLTSVRIRHRRGEAALAWLLAGWLQAAVPVPAGGNLPDVEEDAGLTDVILLASFADGLRLRLESHQVSVDDSLGPAPFTVAVPRESEAEAVAAELRVLTHDVSLHNTLRALVERFGRA